MAHPSLAIRKKAIFDELEQAAKNYLAVRTTYEAAKAALDIARERLAGAKRIATIELDTAEMYAIQPTIKIVEYSAMAMGEAIIAALNDRAAGAAYDHLFQGTPYDPSVSLEQLCEDLESGGFEFRSATPAREVNAALINVKGIERLPNGQYQLANPGMVVDRMRDIMARQENAKQMVKEMERTSELLRERDALKAKKQ